VCARAHGKFAVSASGIGIVERSNGKCSTGFEGSFELKATVRISADEEGG
jgi:hypothetical protein